MSEVDKQDIKDLHAKLDQNQKEFMEAVQAIKEGNVRIITNQETLTANQGEHHETLYDEEHGYGKKIQRLSRKVQRIENVSTAVVAGGGVVAWFVANLDKVKSFFGK